MSDYSKNNNIVSKTQTIQSFSVALNSLAISWPKKKYFYTEMKYEKSKDFIKIVRNFNKFLLKKYGFFYKSNQLSFTDIGCKYLFLPCAEKHSLEYKVERKGYKNLEQKVKLYDNKIDELKKIDKKIKEDLAKKKEYDEMPVWFQRTFAKGKLVKDIPTTKKTKKDLYGPYTSNISDFAKSYNLLSVDSFSQRSLLNLKSTQTTIKKRYEGEKNYEYLKKKIYIENIRETRKSDRFFFDLKNIFYGRQKKLVIDDFFFDIKKKKIKQRKIRLSLFKNIILSDFFLINKKRDNDVLVNKFIKINNNKFFFLDVLKLTKEIRQFFHLLWQVSKTRKSRLNKKQLFFLLENENHSYLADKFFNKIINEKSSDTGLLRNSLAINPTVESQLQYVMVALEKKYKRIIVSSDDLNTDYMLSNLIRNKFFLTSSINTCTSAKSSHYRIFNSLDNIKKLYFLLSLSATVLKKKSNDKEIL